MAKQTALEFFTRARNDATLRSKLEALGGDANLNSLVELAASEGLAINTEDLRTAFKHDWAMRQLRYGQKTTPLSDSLST